MLPHLEAIQVLYERGGQKMKSILIIFASVLLSSCATIVSGTTQSILVDTFNAHGANCKGVDSKGREYYWPDTPSSTTVQKGDAPLVIICTKPGFKKTVHSVDETVTGSVFGNIILGGGIGILVDAISGGAQEYPNIVKFPLKPENDAPKDVLKAYRKYKAKIVEEELEKRKEEQGDPG